MDTNYIIETKNLTKQYGSQKSVADLNIHVKRGRIYGLLGRNGAGKTTTMKMLLGLTKPTSGEVKIWGKSLQGNEKKLLPDEMRLNRLHKTGVPAQRQRRQGKTHRRLDFTADFHIFV